MSWQLPTGDDFLPKISVDRLKRCYDEESEGWPKIRLLIAIKRKEGQSMDAIAKHLRISRTAVNETLHRFQIRGCSAKDDEKRSGRPKELTKPQLINLRKRLLRGPRKGQNQLWTTKMVMDHVEQNYGKKYSARHMRRLLHVLGFSVQKPRPRHYLANVKQQEHFKKTSGKPLGNIGNEASQSFVWMKRS